MKATLANGAVALAFCLALVGASAGGCQDTSKGKHCSPGDTRGSKGHTDVCNKDGKWTPMTKQITPKENARG